MHDLLKTLRRPAAGADTDPSPSLDPARPRAARRWWRWLPWAVGAALAAVWLAVFADVLRPATAVRLETVVTRRAEGPAAAGGPVRALAGEAAWAGAVRFQASGWFEPEPFPHRATALASGVVETVHVLEGERVEAGAPLASLVPAEAELALDAARARLEAARAAARTAAQEHALALAREERAARSLAVARARRAELADLADRSTGLGPGVIAEQEIRQARLRLATHDETVGVLEVEERVAALETERWAAFREQREAEVAAAAASLAAAELTLARQVVRAPVAGVVQRLLVAPGQKKMLAADDPESATVALLFDPAKLQARVDVPLADAGGLFVGQAVLVESEFLAGEPLRGVVTRIVGEADRQRNTLQAKVHLVAPPAGWRPEMLCRARFLETAAAPAAGVAASAPSPGDAPAPAGGVEVLVPRAALLAEAGATAAVWALDPSGQRVERRTLRLGATAGADHRLVHEGLRPGERVVLEPPPGLRPGTRVRPAAAP